MAVLAAGELFQVVFVFTTDEGFGHSSVRVHAEFVGETADFAGNSFHTFFGLNNGHVDIVNSFENFGHRAGFGLDGINISLPSDGDGSDGGE